MLAAAQLTELAESYFRMVDAKDMDGALALLTPDCRITVETAGVVHEGRDVGVRTMFHRLWERYPRVWHGDFRHVPAATGDAIACQFRVINTDATGRQHHMRNCNFFWLQDKLLHRISIYMSGANTLT